MSLLELRGLSKRYGDALAVQALDLTVETGCMLGLLGPNGAGKTTTISMICGVVDASAGSVIVDGHDLAREPFAARRTLGLVPQELALYEELDARQNLSFFGGIYGLRGAKLEHQIDWALEVAGLSARAREPVRKFSGGMKRRLNLVAGLLHAPRLLILDEPTVGVDPQSRNHIFETIRRMHDELGLTVIYTSHYMEEVQALCDRVVIMDGGALIADDTVAGLIRDHGGAGLAIELEDDVESALAALDGLVDSGVSCDARGSVLQVTTPGPKAPIIAAVEASGARIVSLQSMRPDLEAVFMALTGHRLRDD